MSCAVTVYRSSRVADMYLYVPASDDLARVPAELMQRFGKPVLALQFELTPQRTLARADPAVVLAALGDQGFFLQLPPDPAELSFV